MKKILMSLALLLIVPIMFTACGHDLQQKCKDNIADIRYNYFEGETENWRISLTSGMRESPYNYDGKAGELVEFSFVSISAKNNAPNIGYAYQVDINDETLEGMFEQSPYDENNYGVDLGQKVNDTDEIYVYVNNGQTSEVAKLECVSVNFQLNAEQALEQAINEVQNDILRKLSGNFEVYVKVISDEDKTIDTKFWYVLFADENGGEITVIIDPNTKQIILKKV